MPSSASKLLGLALNRNLTVRFRVEQPTRRFVYLEVRKTDEAIVLSRRLQDPDDLPHQVEALSSAALAIFTRSSSADQIVQAMVGTSDLGIMCSETSDLLPLGPVQ